MNKLIVLVLALLLAAVLAGVVMIRQQADPAADRTRLIAAFMTTLPDSLDQQRRDEIAGLLDNFFVHADRGDVAPRDVDEIVDKVEHFVELGTITADSLVYLMAQVGYYTYKMDPRRNLATGEVDHPVLNPEAGSMQVRPDSAFWAEFEEWQKTHKSQQSVDSMLLDAIDSKSR